MAGVKKHIGELIALRTEQAQPGLSAAAAVPMPFADSGNVVPFARSRATRQAPEVTPPCEATRPAGAGGARDRVRLLAFAAVSLVVHGGLFAAFWREPAPLASIGEQVISLEIVVGATAPAGVAQTPGEQEVQAPP